jgi:predicted outer membrane repeat protein
MQLNRTEVFMRLFMTLILAWAINSAMAGGVSEVTVGADGSCDYTSLTAASFGEPPSEFLNIRLAKNAGINALQLLDDRNTFITGGFDTCADSIPSGRSVIDGSGFSGALLVVTASNLTTMRNDLFLSNIELTGGNSNAPGGAFSLTGSWNLVLDNVYIHDNISSQDGGGIYIESASDPSVVDPTVIILNNSIFSNNIADNGGALACRGDVSIAMAATQLANNTVSQNGGAVHAADGCVFEQYGGHFLQGVLLNEATGWGGGLYATNGAMLQIQSGVFDFGKATVISNTAANGGGIAVANGATVHATDAVIDNNTASSTGGGIRSNDGHIIIDRAASGAQCHSEFRCSVVSNNQANGTDPSFSGGGAIATFGGTLSVTGTYLENNSAEFGSAIRARMMTLNGLDPTMSLVGNVVAKNQTAAEVVYLDDSSADIAFTTFVDNEDNDQVIRLAYPTTATEAHEVTVSGSVFDQAGSTVESALLTTAGQLPVGDCNRNEANSTGNLAGQPRSTSLVVQFEDRAGGDYRLLEGSSLVDYCDGSILGVGSNHSANGFVRPINDAVSNTFGTYDLGGLEWYALDVIFDDDFE